MGSFFSKNDAHAEGRAQFDSALPQGLFSPQAASSLVDGKNASKLTDEGIRQSQQSGGVVQDAVSKGSTAFSVSSIASGLGSFLGGLTSSYKNVKDASTNHEKAEEEQRLKEAITEQTTRSQDADIQSKNIDMISKALDVEEARTDRPFGHLDYVLPADRDVVNAAARSTCLAIEYRARYLLDKFPIPPRVVYISAVVDEQVIH